MKPLYPIIELEFCLELWRSNFASELHFGDSLRSFTSEIRFGASLRRFASELHFGDSLRFGASLRRFASELHFGDSLRSFTSEIRFGASLRRFASLRSFTSELSAEKLPFSASIGMPNHNIIRWNNFVLDCSPSRQRYFPPPPPPPPPPLIPSPPPRSPWLLSQKPTPQYLLTSQHSSFMRRSEMWTPHLPILRPLRAPQGAVNNHWTGLLDWTTGLDYWTTNLTTRFQLRSKNSI